VHIDSSAPGGLTKLAKDMSLWTDEERAPFAAANEARMQGLRESLGDAAVYIFTDGARRDDTRETEACAGAYVVCKGQNPNDASTRLLLGFVPVSPIACTYTAEIAAIHAALVAVLAQLEIVFAGVAPGQRRLVVVTDSKSSLDALAVTWARRMQLLEQQTSRLLFDLATGGVDVTLSFVFSHVGGAPGNAYADDLAEEALKAVGRLAPGSRLPHLPRRLAGTVVCEPVPLWHVDTPRRANNDRHRAADTMAGRRRDDATLAFRFRSLPRDLHFAPSSALPPTMTRKDEIAVYRARLGMLPRVGGSIAGQPDECPICRQQDALGRDGTTFTHWTACAGKLDRSAPSLCAATLWLDPTAAAVQLESLYECALRFDPPRTAHVLTQRPAAAVHRTPAATPRPASVAAPRPAPRGAAAAPPRSATAQPAARATRASG
jgi:ribonuclease HI